VKAKVGMDPARVSEPLKWHFVSSEIIGIIVSRPDKEVSLFVHALQDCGHILLPK
jgi:hypothetical protein